LVKQPDAWPAEQPLGGSAGQLGGLRLEPVTDKATSRLWNGLIERWHYLGYSPLAGAQLRYPIACSLPLPRGEHRTGHHQRYEGLFQPFQQADEGAQKGARALA